MPFSTLPVSDPEVSFYDWTVLHKELLHRHHKLFDANYLEFAYQILSSRVLTLINMDYVLTANNSVKMGFRVT